MNTFLTHSKGLIRLCSITLVLAMMFSLFGWVSQPARADYQQQEGPGKRNTALFDLKAGPTAQTTPLLTVANSAASITVPVVDVTIDERTPSVNDWDGYYLRTGYDEYQRQRFLIKPLLSSLPPNAVITDATLSLALVGWGEYGTTVRAISFYRITSPWHPNLATWNNPPTTAEPVGTMSVGTPSSTTRYSVNLTSLVQGWYQGTLPNHGMLVTGPEGGLDVYRAFGASGTYIGDTYCGPILTITYTFAPPTLSASSVSFLTDNNRVPLKPAPLKISNSGSKALEWAVANKPAWLSLSSTSGLLGPNSSVNITATASTAGMSTGTYTAPFQITSTTPGVAGSPASINAKMAYVQSAGRQPIYQLPPKPAQLPARPAWLRYW